MPLPFIFSVRHFKELDSTNTYASAQAEAGATEGQVYAADFQTHGRGQFDRTWESPAGKNLLCSILLRPPMAPAEAPLITQLTAQSIAAVLEKKYGIAASIKKPNDILAQGRKICGILVESSSRSPQKVEHVIIGVGLNVNEAPKEIQPPAISMKEITGKEYKIRPVLDHLLGQLGQDLEKLYAPCT